MSFISIIIPNLNQAEKLDRCLKSLCSQIVENQLIKILVIDNGSVDESLSVIKKYGVDYLIYQEKQSPYAARNYGIKKVSSEIICLMDSKCLPSDNYINQLIAQSKKLDWDIVGGRFYYIGLNINSSIAEIAYSMLYLKTDPKYFSGTVSALTGNMMVRMETIETIGFFNERRAVSDVEFVQRAYANKLKIVFNKHILAGYEPLKRKELINITIRNKKYSYNPTKLSALKPPGYKYFFSRLNELNIEIGFFKKIRLYLFIWHLRFLKYFTEVDKNLTS